MLKRADETVPGIKLSEIITASILVSPETPKPGPRSLLWIEKLGSRVIDEGSKPTLEFLASDEDGAEPEGGDSVVEAVSVALKGQIWDSEDEDWQ